MDELAARAVLVQAPDVRDGLTTSIPRTEIEDVLGQDEMPIELVLDLTRFSDGEAAETRSLAVSWERNELEQLLEQAEGDEVTLTFDRETLSQAIDGDVEAHGIRELALAVAIAATAATGAATAASAEPGPYLGGDVAIAQTGTGPDDRAFTRGGPAPSLSPDDRAVPRGVQEPPATPGVSPDDRAFPRAPAPAPEPVVSPDDRAVPRSTPVEAPVGGTVSDPGISWAPTPAETAALAGAIALVITGAFFVVGGRRRVRPGTA